MDNEPRRCSGAAVAMSRRVGNATLFAAVTGGNIVALWLILRSEAFLWSASSVTCVILLWRHFFGGQVRDFDEPRGKVLVVSLGALFFGFAATRQSSIAYEWVLRGLNLSLMGFTFVIVAGSVVRRLTNRR